MGAPPEAVPAEFGVTVIDPRDGHTAIIFSCADHLAATVRTLHELAPASSVFSADPGRHGCKGHQESWPATRPGDGVTR